MVPDVQNHRIRITVLMAKFKLQDIEESIRQTQPINQSFEN